MNKKNCKERVTYYIPESTGGSEVKWAKYFTHENWYNQDGNPVKQVSHDETGVWYDLTIQTLYDASGRQVASFNKIEDQEMDNLEIIRRDSAGHILEKLSFGKEFKMSLREIYHYSKDFGSAVVDVIDLKNPDNVETIEEDYDKNGELVKSFRYNADHTFERLWRKQVEKDGSVITRENGTISGMQSDEASDGKKSSSTYLHEEHFDAEGNLFYIYILTDSARVYRYENEYDAKGRLSRRTCKMNGAYSSLEIFEYDDDVPAVTDDQIESYFDLLARYDDNKKFIS